MPLDKFGKHYLSHDDDVLFLVDDLPKMYYETQLVVMGLRFPGQYQIFNGRPHYEVFSPTGIITHVNCSSLLKLYINGNEVNHGDLIGQSLNKGDLISFKPDGNKTPYIGGVEFTLKSPIISE